jgi:signal transduction histidine kinase
MSGDAQLPRRDQEAVGVMRALVNISRAASTPAPLTSILSKIAENVEELVGAQAAAILLMDGHHRLGIAGGRGIVAENGESFAGAALGRIPDPGLRAVIVSDIESDGRFELWRASFRRAGYRSVAALSLVLSARPIGSLVVYKRETHEWSEQEVGVIELIGEHVASAVRAAQLLDEQKHRLAAHTRLLRGLREQSLDHVARIKAFRDQLERADEGGVAELVADFETQLSETYAVVLRQIRPSVIAGLLWGEFSIARQKGVVLRLDRRSRLTQLPSRLCETAAVSLIGNLLQNAFDAVDGMPSSRRKVTLWIGESERSVRFRVRDWGVGLQELTDRDLLEHGFSTKSGHDGVGLAVVAAIAGAAGGRVEVARPPVGAVFDVVVPRD